MKRHGVTFSGYSVHFSPFRQNFIAVASSQYFGIAGNGKVSILDFQRGAIIPVVEFGTRDACFDVAFSEMSESVLATACGDGSVRIFDLHRPGDRPVAVFNRQKAETYSVNWNAFSKNLLCSASWDRSVVVHDVVSGKEQMRYMHTGISYESRFSPRNATMMASVGGDGQLLVCDMRQSSPSVKIQEGAEILCVDWNKYRDTVVATGSVDRLVRVYDIRTPGKPLHVFDNHQLAVRRVRFSPHSDSLLLSCSYDMSVKLCSLTSPVKDSFDHHTEFVIGIDFSNFERDLVASTSWDRSVAIWSLGQQPKPQLAPRRRAAVANI
jgi:peroxin-7